mmetsp:Transcript_11752/g.38673  ORF Transcript_11752/g.38673 Transcript_11752/m.38673 type:complete len:108 (+) Transcript_11752:101-424(+)
MRLVLQRVLEARVVVAEATVGAIGRGLVALVGIHEDDERADVDWAVEQISRTSFWPERYDDEADEGRPWATSLLSAVSTSSACRSSRSAVDSRKRRRDATVSRSTAR